MWKEEIPNKCKYIMKNKRVFIVKSTKVKWLSVKPVTAVVAQSVEHWSYEPEVAGSIPANRRLLFFHSLHSSKIYGTLYFISFIISFNRFYWFDFYFSFTFILNLFRESFLCYLSYCSMFWTWSRNLNLFWLSVLE